jgi:hypothetical protein
VELQPHRSAVPLLNDLEKRLTIYALAAGGAGAVLLGAVQPAAAEIIYTPKDVKLTKGGLFIDLNLDSVPDFNIGFHTIESFTYQDGRYTGRKLVLGGATNASVVASNGSAAALAAGSVIGSGRKFKDVTTKRAQMMLAESFESSSGLRASSARGNWKNVQSRYLGLKFKINGQTHYGWARFSVRYTGYTWITATLLGFAYETNADQSIHAGQTTEAQIGEVAPSTIGAESGTLGLLALGVNGRATNP